MSAAPRPRGAALRGAVRRHVARVRARCRADEGSAVVEFVGVSVVLLVPLVHLVLVLGQLQAATFAADGAARESARAMVTGDVDASAARAVAAAGVALADQGVDAGAAADAVSIACAPACHEPGATVTVRVRLAVPILGSPRAWSDRLPASIEVTSVATATVDRFAGAP